MLRVTVDNPILFLRGFCHWLGKSSSPAAVDENKNDKIAHVHQSVCVGCMGRGGRYGECISHAKRKESQKATADVIAASLRLLLLLSIRRANALSYLKGLVHCSACVKYMPLDHSHLTICSLALVPIFSTHLFPIVVFFLGAHLSLC